MAYFPNGTSGMCFEEQFCCKCVHGQSEGCPVWDLHLLMNYDQLKAGQENLRLGLNMLIQDDPAECKMFLPFGGTVVAPVRVIREDMVLNPEWCKKNGLLL